MKDRILTLLLISMLSLAACNTPETSEQQSTSPTASQTAEVKKDSTIQGEKKAINTEKSALEWQAYKVIGGHNGTIQLKSGEVIIDNNMIVGGTFTIDMQTIKDADGSEGLENHLKNEDFFDVKNHTTATLTITNVEKNEGDDYTITGDLTIKGITHSITFNAKITQNGDQYSATAEKITIDRTKYDITFKSASFFSDLGDGVIEDNFDLKVTIVTK